MELGKKMKEIINITYPQTPKFTTLTFLVRKMRKAKLVKTLKTCDAKTTRPE
jgi:hypothetical protein